MILPETPEDIVLKKKLLKLSKDHMKVVLRRADKMKIPMELPEAKEIAIKEIIEKEIESEEVHAKAEMKKEAMEEEMENNRKVAEKHQIEDAAKNRKKKRALVIIQTRMRIFLATKKARFMAYKHYKKHFDPGLHDYFYEEERTGRTTWTKPVSLGSYDITMDTEAWVTMRDEENNVYFYNPGTWTISWELPGGCVLCDECGVEFAVAYMNHDQKFYCNTHMYIQAQLLLEEDWDANDISYKEFEGHRNGAIFEHLHYYPDTTWLTYIYSKSIDRTRKLSAEEEQAEREKMLMKDEAASERKRKEREVHTYTYLYHTIHTYTHLYTPIPHCTALYTPIPHYTHLYTPILTYTHLYTPIPHYTHLFTPIHTYTHLYSPILTYTTLYTPIHTFKHLYLTYTYLGEVS